MGMAYRFCQKPGQRNPKAQRATREAPVIKIQVLQSDPLNNEIIS